MKTIKVSEATNVQLNWLVAIIEFPPGNYGGSAEHYSGNNGERWIRIPNKAERRYDLAKYTTSWSQMGPIIEREGIRLDPPRSIVWWDAEKNGHMAFGPTPLIAAARCFVQSKLGETVEVPEELT